MWLLDIRQTILDRRTRDERQGGGKFDPYLQYESWRTCFNNYVLHICLCNKQRWTDSICLITKYTNKYQLLPDGCCNFRTNTATKVGCVWKICWTCMQLNRLSVSVSDFESALVHYHTCISPLIVSAPRIFSFCFGTQLDKIVPRSGDVDDWRDRPDTQHTNLKWNAKWKQHFWMKRVSTTELCSIYNFISEIFIRGSRWCPTVLLGDLPLH